MFQLLLISMRISNTVLVKLAQDNHQLNFGNLFDKLMLKILNGQFSLFWGRREDFCISLGCDDSALSDAGERVAIAVITALSMENMPGYDYTSRER